MYINENSLYSKKCFKSTTIEKGSYLRSGIVEQSQSIFETSSSKDINSEELFTFEDSQRCKIRSSNSREKYNKYKHMTVETNIDSFFCLESSKIKNSRVPKIKKSRSQTFNYSSVRTIYHKTNTMVDDVDDSYKNSQSYNPQKSDVSQKSSKLPVLMQRKSQPLERPKKSHWTEKYNQKYDSEKYRKFNTHNISHEQKNKMYDQMYQLSNNLGNENPNPLENISAFRRHNILTPIASVSSSEESYISIYSSSCNVSDIVETSKEALDDRTHFFELQPKKSFKTKNMCSKSHSDSLTLYFHRRHLQPLNDKVKKCHVNCVKQSEPWGQDRKSSCRRPPRLQRYNIEIIALCINNLNNFDKWKKF